MSTYSNILKYIDSTTYLKQHKELICQYIENTTIIGCDHVAVDVNSLRRGIIVYCGEHISIGQYVICMWENGAYVTNFGNIFNTFGKFAGNIYLKIDSRKTPLCDGILNIIKRIHPTCDTQQKHLNELYVLNDLMITYRDMKNKYDIVEIYNVVEQLQQENVIIKNALKQLQSENLEYKKIIESLGTRLNKLEAQDTHQTMTFL